MRVGEETATDTGLAQLMQFDMKFRSDAFRECRQGIHGVRAELLFDSCGVRRGKPEVNR